MNISNTIKIAVITDLHFGVNTANIKRKCDIADTLLMRTVFRFNRVVKPDVTLILGDIIDDPDSEKAEDNLKYMKSIFDKLKSPYIIIPGNHDGDPERFYKIFSRPKNVEEVCGVKFLSFIDKEEPGYNAGRSSDDISRICKARENFSGAIITLQHVCLFPPELKLAPYNYINAKQIIDVLKENEVLLSVSGHHHNGEGTIKVGKTSFINAPGLCEAQFPYTIINIIDGEILRETHELAMPKDLMFVDNHIHTQLAYCSDNMDVKKAISLGKEIGLAGMKFTEHSGQLYFDNKNYWNKQCLKGTITSAIDKHNRMSEYIDIKNRHQNNFVRFGLEVDCDFNGDLLIKPEDSEHFDFIIGAIHNLPDTDNHNDEFMKLLKKLLTNNIDVLAHPFRVFKRGGTKPPGELFLPTAKLLKEYNTAAEINFHTNEPPVEFIKNCLELGVKFSFASDAHYMAELGDFFYHMELLKEAGYRGDFRDILISK